MKRTVGAVLILAGLGGGCVSPNRSQPGPQFNQVSRAKEIPGVVGPMGQPIAQGANGQAFVSASDGMGVTPASYSARGSGYDIQQAGFLKGGAGHSAGGCDTCGNGGGLGGGGAPAFGHFIGGPRPEKHGGLAVNHQIPKYYPGGGIVPAPAMGPPGAVAAVGALPPYGGLQPVNARTSIKFADPAGMNVTWFGPNGLNDVPLITPARYNFAQGGIYRLKLSNINKHPGLDLYPTLEVYPATAESVTFLAHSSVPISFTEADIEQVSAGNFLTKVIYLPNPQYQDLSVLAGPTEIVSSPLEPGMDPVVEAQKRGTVLLIIRMGNIDLQVPNSPAMDAPNPYLQLPPRMPLPVMPGVPGAVPGPVPAMPSTIPPAMSPTIPGKTTAMPKPLAPLPTVPPSAPSPAAPSAMPMSLPPLK